VTVAAEVRSFARAAKVLDIVADIEISSRHVGRLAHRIGTQLADENRQRAADHQAKTLKVEVTNIPEVAVVEVDGGRLRTREEGHGPGTHEPAWKESKNGLCCRMSSRTHKEDPAPELPSSLAVHSKVKRLAREIHGSSAGSGESALERARSGQADPADEDSPLRDTAAVDDTAGKAPLGKAGTGPAAAEYEPPTRLMRTCLSSLCDVRTFGEQLAAEAHRKGFGKAKRKAFVADGMACNWTMHARHFADYEPVTDFIHVIGYVYDTAVAIGGGEEFAWGMCHEWLTGCWQGRVSDVLKTLKTWQSEHPLPTDESVALARDDPREIVRRSVVYLSNNQSRMNYPEYRRQGLPLTSALMESFVKEMNWRVKGTEMFWNNPSGAEAILALRAATLSEDSRLAETLP
jgi:hypothetical protein